MTAAWAFPFIFVAGALQAVGAAMGGERDKSLGNPWLATSISFMLVLFVTAALFACMPITANIPASLAIDHFGLLRMEQHSLNPMRIAGAVRMIGGVTPISKF
jgi:transporter family-2 protein